MKQPILLITLAASLLMPLTAIHAALAEEKPADKPAPDPEITVASYYFGNYHPGD